LVFARLHPALLQSSGYTSLLVSVLESRLKLIPKFLPLFLVVGSALPHRFPISECLASFAVLLYVELGLERDTGGFANKPSGRVAVILVESVIYINNSWPSSVQMVLLR